MRSPHCGHKERLAEQPPDKMSSNAKRHKLHEYTDSVNLVFHEDHMEVLVFTSKNRPTLQSWHRASKLLPCRSYGQ